MSAKEFTVFVATLMSIVALSIDALLPAFNFIVSDLNVTTPNKIQLVITTLFIGLACGQLFFGPLSDALGRKPILYIALTVYLTGTLICYLSTNINTLLLGRFIQGLGAAGPNITAVSLVRDQYKGREMAKIMSIVMMIFITVPTIAPALGQAILLIADWRTTFTLYALYAVILFIWFHFRLSESLAKENRIPLQFSRLTTAFKEALGNKQTSRLMVCMGMTFGCLLGYINSCQQIFQELFNTGKLFSLYFGSLALLLGLSSLANSRLVEKLGMQFLASRALTVIIISSSIFFILQNVIDIKLWMFLLYTATLFGSFGFIFGNFNTLAMEPMGHMAGIGAAVIGATSSLISVTIGTIIGQLYNDTVLPVTLGPLILTSAALLLMRSALNPSKQ